jgi:hypothetical protein
MLCSDYDLQENVTKDDKYKTTKMSSTDTIIIPATLELS